MLVCVNLENGKSVLIGERGDLATDLQAVANRGYTILCSATSVGEMYTMELATDYRTFTAWKARTPLTVDLRFKLMESRLEAATKALQSVMKRLPK